MQGSFAMGGFYIATAGIQVDIFLGIRDIDIAAGSRRIAD